MRNRSSSKRKNWEQLEKENKDKKFSFHLLPKDIDRQNQWLEAIGLKNWKPCKTAAICSAHFNEEDFESNLAVKRLKKDAAPHLSGISTPMLTSPSLRETNRLPDTREALENTNAQSHLPAENVEFFEVDAINEEIVETTKQSRNVDGNRGTSRNSSNNMVHRSTSVSPERIFNSPNMVNLREIHQREIKSLKKQLYRATYNEKRAKKEVQILRAVVKDLRKRNLTMTNDGNVLRYLAEDVQELVKCGAKNQKTSSTPRRWKPSLFKLALSLHFYSPKAYNFLRYKFSNALPHPKTISKWYRTM